MNPTRVTMVRIYLHEAQGQVEDLLGYLHDECQVRGVTVFRGITGFGVSGQYHSSSLVDLSLDLPVVIEFFEEEEKIKPVLEELNNRVKPGHMVSWAAQINLS